MAGSLAAACWGDRPELKKKQTEKPKLFVKRVHKQPGLDN
jgi:hypothetical protein